MCKYEKEWASIVEVRVDTILSTDGWTDGRMMWNQYTPFQFRWGGEGYNNYLI